MNQLVNFNQEQIALIKSQVAKDSTNEELAMFLHQCKRTGLDPLTRQIYFVKRGGRMTIQTSIDGFRVIAERSGTYAGQDVPLWTYDKDGEILNCAVTVYRFSPDGQRYPAGVGVAFYKEYYPNPMNLQKSLKHTMISKVAEALALRKAFPQDLSGLYTGDEMNQANKFEDVPSPGEIQLLRDLVFSSTLDEEKRMLALESIEKCTDYDTYTKIQFRLEDCQQGYDDVPNPNQKDIKKQIKKITG